MRVMELVALVIALGMRHWKTLGLGLAGFLYTMFALGALSMVSGVPIPMAPLIVILGAIFFMSKGKP